MRTQEERAAWRASGWDARDGVAELYGVVEPPPGLRVLLFDRARLIAPPEDPALRLLPLDRRAGEDVLTTKALGFRALVAGGCAGLLGALLLLARARSLRRLRQHDEGQLPA